MGGLPKIKLIVFDTKRVKMKFSHTRDRKGETQPLAKKPKFGMKRALQEGEVDYSVELDFKPAAKTMRGFELDQPELNQRPMTEKTSTNGDLIRIPAESSFVTTAGDKSRQMKLSKKEKRNKKDKKKQKESSKKKKEHREMILEELIMSEDEDYLDGIATNYLPNENAERSSTDIATSGVVKNKQIRKERKREKDKNASERSAISRGKKESVGEDEAAVNEFNNVHDITLKQVLSESSSVMNSFGLGVSGSAW